MKKKSLEKSENNEDSIKTDKNDSKLNDDPVIIEKDEKLPNFYSKKGHFILGDIPNKIVDYFQSNDEIFVTIEWKPKEGKKIPPKNTSLPTKVVKKHDVEFLIKFYESKLDFRKREKSCSSSKQNNKNYCNENNNNNNQKIIEETENIEEEYFSKDVKKYKKKYSRELNI